MVDLLHINDIMGDISNHQGILNIGYAEYVVPFKDYYIEVHPFAYMVYEYMYFDGPRKSTNDGWSIYKMCRTHYPHT